MKLLICTQVVDKNHPILGFFHRWIEEFAKHCEVVHVIALQVGEYDLPSNVYVHSLGKEDSTSKFTQLFCFWHYLWQLRRQYNAVFVHMIPLYVILGAPFWRAFGKRIGLWYTHGSVPFALRIADFLVHDIFTASPDSCNLQSQKIRVTGHGIDTEHFRPQHGVEKDIDLITVGRITESKNLIALIDALAEVRRAHDISLTIVGAAVTAGETAHEASLRALIASRNLTSHVHFIGRVSQANLPQVLNRAKVFVTTAQNGSLDKAVLEALASDLPVVSMAAGTRSLPLGDQQVESLELMASQILKSINNPQKYVDFIQKRHALKNLILKIINQLES